MAATFHRMAEASGLGLWAADAAGRILSANRAAARMLGWEIEELVGHDLAAIAFPEDLESMTLRGSADELQAAQLLERRFKRKDGGEAWLLVSVVRREVAGRNDGWLGISLDVTEGHRARDRADRAEAALLQLGAGISECIWLEDAPTGEITYVSPNAERVWGCAAAALQASPDAWMDIVHPEDRERVTRAWRGGASSGEIAVEFRILHREGAIRWVRGRSFPVYAAGGKLMQVARTWEDVTERAWVADRLRLQAAALDCAANAFVVTDERGVVEWTNPAFTRLSGYHPEQVLGQPTRLLKSGVQDEQFYRRLWETIRAGRVWHGVLVNRRADGALYDEEMTISPVTDLDGHIRHFVAVKQDVTDARRAAESLRETQELLSQATDAIVLAALDGQVLTWTQGAERLFGLKAAEAIGRDVADLLGLDRPEQLGEIRAAVDSCGSFTGDLRVRSRSGAVLDVASRWSRVHDLAGKPRGLLVVAHDVTARRRLELVAARTERLEMLGQVASAVAHDLNNVLTAIFSALPILRESHTEAEGAEVLDTVDRAAQLAQGLVRQVVDFARGSSGARKKIRGADLLLAAMKLVRPTTPQNIRLRNAWTPDLCTVEADATQVQQVLVNLCVNAREAMPGGGTLLVAAANVAADEELLASTPGLQPGSYLEVRVTDTGCGIPPEIMQKLFEPFLTTKERGTGLGLAIVYRVVTAHGGAIAATSEVGRGTEFRLYLPAADTGEPARAAP